MEDGCYKVSDNVFVLMFEKELVLLLNPDRHLLLACFIKNFIKDSYSEHAKNTKKENQKIFSWRC